MSSKNTSNKGSLPILILAGTVLFIALILEIIRLMAFSEPTKIIDNAQGYTQTHRSQTSENLFDNIHKKYPAYKNVVSRLVKKKISFSPHNYVLGNPKAKVRVVIFNDNDCAVCRHELKRVTRELKPYLKDVLVIFKHMPADKNKESMSSIFGQMAIHRGVYKAFLKAINTPKIALKTTEDYLVLLEKIGISLPEQRAIMIDGMSEILSAVQKDVTQAIKVGAYLAKHQPVIYLNGYQLGNKFLPEHKMTFYIEKLIKDGFIVSSDEVFIQAPSAKK